MGARTSVLPDLLSQASPATPPRHDRSTSEEVRNINKFDLVPLLLNYMINLDQEIRCDKIIFTVNSSIIEKKYFRASFSNNFQPAYCL
jgi:hypothetical protein